MKKTNLIKIDKADSDRKELFDQMLGHVIKYSNKGDGTLDIDKFYDSLDVLTQLIILRTSARIVKIKNDVTYKGCKKLVNKFFLNGTDIYLERIFDFVTGKTSEECTKKESL